MPLVTRLYVEGSSPVHRLNARVKIVWVLIVFLAVMTFNDPFYQAAILASILLVAVYARLSLRQLLGLARPILIVGSLIALMWALFARTGTIFFEFWVFRVSDISVMYGIAVGMRVISLVLAFYVVLQTTEQADLLYGLIALKMPYTFAFIVTAIFRFAPTIAGEAETIREAQRARAMDFETGSIQVRIRKSTSFLIPLIVRVLKTTLELSIALSAKAYGAFPTRTFHRERPLTARERVLVISLILLQVLFIALRYLGYGAVLPGNL
jgi:energy-coupling factor transport system permease protein